MKKSSNQILRLTAIAFFIASIATIATAHPSTSESDHLNAANIEQTSIILAHGESSGHGEGGTSNVPDSSASGGGTGGTGVTGEPGKSNIPDNTVNGGGTGGTGTPGETGKEGNAPDSTMSGGATGGTGTAGAPGGASDIPEKDKSTGDMGGTTQSAPGSSDVAPSGR